MFKFGDKTDKCMEPTKCCCKCPAQGLCENSAPCSSMSDDVVGNEYTPLSQQTEEEIDSGINMFNELERAEDLLPDYHPADDEDTIICSAEVYVCSACNNAFEVKNYNEEGPIGEICFCPYCGCGDNDTPFECNSF